MFHDYPSLINISYHNGQDQQKHSPKQAHSCWFVRHNLLATSGASLYPPGECRVLFLWCYICFVLFRLRLFAFVEAVALRPIVLRYVCAPAATRSQLPTVCVLFCFGSVLFLFCFFLCFFGNNVPFSECFVPLPFFSFYGKILF